MKTAIVALIGLLVLSFIQVEPSAEEILDRVDANMASKSKIISSTMVIHGRRGSRSISSKSYMEGDHKSFTEYLAPAREKGTKMLKLEDQLWIYSPSTERVIQLSGHMLKQSVMGSDLSYEDLMEDDKLLDQYSAAVKGSAVINGRNCWLLELNAKLSDVSYHKRKIWVDKDRFVPLQEELYAKSGQLLKKTTMSEVSRSAHRWYPRKMNYRDMLKNGKGTDFIVDEIEFDAAIPAHVFTKASLRK